MAPLLRSLLAAAVLAAPAASSSAACSSLVDWDAPLFSALPLALDVTLAQLQALHVDLALAPVDELFPAFSRCVASGDLVGALLSVSTGSECLTQLTGLVGGSGGSAGLSSAALEAELCPLVNATLLPCVDALVPGLLESFFTSAGDCCTDFQSDVSAALGLSLADFLKQAVELLANLLCSVQTDAATGSKRTCATAWVQGLGTERVMVDATKLLQLPDDQVCAAATGKDMATTTGQAYQLFSETTPVDSCFAPLDVLVRNVSQLPFVAASAGAQVLFSNSTGDSACLSGLSVLNDARDPDGVVMRISAGFDDMVAALQLVDNSSTSPIATEMDRGFASLESTFGALCLHLAQSSSECDYSSALEFAYATGDDTSSIDPSGASGSDASSATAVALSAWSAAFVVLALAF